MAQRRNDARSTAAWERQEAARAAREEARQRREAEQQHKAAERSKREQRVRVQQERAERLTAEASQRTLALSSLLKAALARTDPVITFDAMKRQVTPPILDLGLDTHPVPPPQWERFLPPVPGVVVRVFGGHRRYERDLEIAEHSFAAARLKHDEDEIARQQRVVAARTLQRAHLHQLHQEADEHNRSIDELQRRFLARDRHAVSAYFQRALDTVQDSQDFPRARRVGYVPESTLLAIEWDLPPVSIIPVEREFTYVKSRDIVEARKTRPLTEIRTLYQALVAQIALRALHLALKADRQGVVDTVVFNGMINDVDPATGHKIRPCLITLRATRDHFKQVNLNNVDPVKCVRQHFAADVSPHPDELTPVTPVLNFDMADPRIIDPIDILSDIDTRPNLLELSPKEFEHFVQNLFARLGFDTKLFRADGDGGIDCIAYDPTPIRGGKYVIQVKLYTKTVQPSAVRDLFGVVHSEGATKGILITTSGFGPSSYEFANGKPLQLYDGAALLALCCEHNIPARILHTQKTSKHTK